MVTRFEQVFLEGAGFFLPGAPVDNEAMDAYIAPINRASRRIKQRILAENGITQRHYAIGPDGATCWSNAELAAEALRAALRDAGRSLGELGLLAAGTSGGDAIMPGFATMVQGVLAAPPMQTHTSIGVCASSVGALEFAAAQIELGGVSRAGVVGSDLPSRMFKSTRFAPQGYECDFNAHFLRWMLSDGAGALVLTRAPQRPKRRLALRWIHQKSFGGDHPVCMQLGMPAHSSKSYLDYDSAAAAEAAGALALRQDIRLLPQLFDVAIHEYVALVREGCLTPARVAHFLCHYSSERFRPVVDELMRAAGLAIPAERWYSNLSRRGNTGAASIFVMLAEFLQTHPELAPGTTIFAFVPESGRFTVSYMLWEVLGDEAPNPTSLPRPAPAAAPDGEMPIPAPHAAEDLAADEDPRLVALLQALAEVWHDYRSRAWRTPLLAAVRTQRLSRTDYLQWMADWIPQVREGSRWMRAAVAQLHSPYEALAALIETHAGEEQDDFGILFDDYRSAGGARASLDELHRNPGGEALNAYLHALAAAPNPVALLGAIYLIEGTGQRIVPALLPLLQAQLGLPARAFRFLGYHGANDVHHLQRWLQAVRLVLAHDEDGVQAHAIVATARRTAELYLMQIEHAHPARSAAP